MRKSTWKGKVIATVLVFCMMFSYCSSYATFLSEFQSGTFGQEEYAANIDMDAYVLSDTGEKNTEYFASTKDGNLVLNVHMKVNAGYVKNPVLTIQNLDKEVFEIDEKHVDSEFIQSISGNQIIMTRLTEGEDVVVEVPIRLREVDYYSPARTMSSIEFVLSGTYADSEGEHVEISKSCSMILGWNTVTNAEILSNVEKSFSYRQDGKKYLLVQYGINVGLSEDSVSFPVESTSINFKLPENSSLIPQTVAVDALATAFTDGRSGSDVKFTSENWSYEADSRNVEIRKVNYANEEQEGKYIVPQGKDKYIVTVTYEVTGNEQKVSTEIYSTIRVFSGGTTSAINANGSLEYNLENTAGSLVTYGVEYEKESISKGNLYANYNLKENEYYETEYSNVMDINISKADFVSTVEVKERDEYFTDADGVKYSAAYLGKDNTYYKTTTFSKANLDQILGENGKLKILTGSGETLITIDKNQEADENGNIVVTYNKKIGKVIIKVDKPESEGILTILNTKVIGKLSYPKSRVIKFNKFVTEYTAAALYNGKIRDDIGDIRRTIKLKGTKTASTFSMSRKSLSTLTENKNIDLKIALNNYNDKTDLYKNPVFEIKFPKEIEEIKVNSASILYGNNELSLANIESYKDKSQIVFKISLKGTQTKYSLVELTEGTNILLNVDVKVNIYTPTTKGKLQMYYYNESATNYESAVPWKMDTARNGSTIINANGKYETELLFEGPSGVVTGEKLSGYNDKKKLSSLSQGIKIDRILTNVEGKNVNSEMIIMNNSDKDMKNVSVLGRIPFEGNKSFVTDEFLGTTFDTKMISEVSQTYGVYKNVDIYYSESEVANKDLKDNSNKWTKNYKELDNVKSFLIVYKEDLKVGEVTTYSYDFSIPKDMECNQSAYSSFAVYYTSDDQENVQESDVLGLETVKTPKIEVHISSNAGDKVTNGQMVKYTVAVQNKGEVNAEDVSFTLDIPKESTYIRYIKPDEDRDGYYKKESNVKQLKIDVGDIVAGEEKIYNYSVLVNDSASVLDEAKVKATVEGIEETETKKEETKEEPASKDNTEDNTVENEINKEDATAEPLTESKTEDTVEGAEVEIAELEVNFSQNKDGNKVIENEDLIYSIFIRNNTDMSDPKTIKNIKARLHVPEGAKIFRAFEIESSVDNDNENTVIDIGKYDESTRIYELDIDKLEPEESKSITVVLKTEYFSTGATKDIVTTLDVDADGFTTISPQPVNNTITRPVIKTTFTSDSKSKYLKPGDVVKYKLVAENSGQAVTSGLTMKYVVPDGLEPVNGKYYLASGGSVGNVDLGLTGAGDISKDIPVGDKLTVELTLKAKDITEKEKVVTSFVSFEARNIKDSFESEKIVHIIQKDTTETDNEVKKSTTKVSSNTNTSTSSNKAKVQKTSAVSTNVDEELSSKNYRISGRAWNDSNKDGKRDNSEKGISNILLKLYDAETNKVVKQTTTDESGEYTFSGLQNGKYYIIFNYDKSKYTLTEYQKEGVDSTRNSDAIVTSSIAITDVITIDSANAGDIDIGLTDPSTFDLTLSKSISKVTVNTKKGTKEYKFNNTNLAKVDIHAKELSSAKVYVEYTLTVANKGEISGFAKSLVDYLPKGMSFDSNLNKDWFERDGKLYSKSLARQEIKPGQSKSIKLVLIKQMTNSNTGTTSNSAEIAKSSNDMAVEDIDSKAGNSKEGEDDYSTADIIISVRTGGTLLNITALVISFGIAAVIGYLFKKEVIERMRRW